MHRSRSQTIAPDSAAPDRVAGYRGSVAHGKDLRFAVALPGRRYYVRILFGRERRKPGRYRAEGYVAGAPSPAAWGLLAAGIACLAAGAAIGSWLVWLILSQT